MSERRIVSWMEVARSFGAENLELNRMPDAKDEAPGQHPALGESAPPARSRGTTRSVNRESILSLTNSMLRNGWQDDVKADLKAQLEAGATLYGSLEDGSLVAQSKSGSRVVPPLFVDEDGSKAP